MGAGYDALQQQSHALLPEAATGNRYADKLIRVHTIGGDDRILAVEVQAQPTTELPRRVYVYHYRADDCFSGPPESLVILADDNPSWRPESYEVRLKYTTMTFSFEPAKLLHWRGREDELREHENPMALFVLTHLEAQRTRNDDQERAKAKLDLLLRVAARKLEEDDRRHWHRFLGWLLPLPDELEKQVYAQATEQTRDKEKDMEFVSYMERQGETRGLLSGLRTALRIRFGAASESVIPLLAVIDQPDRLQELLTAAEQVASLDDFRAQLSPPTNGTH